MIASVQFALEMKDQCSMRFEIIVNMNTKVFDGVTRRSPEYYTHHIHEVDLIIDIGQYNINAMYCLPLQFSPFQPCSKAYS